MSEVLWRCRECGKWSHAKRDPIAHKRWHHEGPEAWRGWFVWCGPFDRWTANHDDEKPRERIFNFGDPVSLSEREIALDEYAPDDTPFPF